MDDICTEEIISLRLSAIKFFKKKTDMLAISNQRHLVHFNENGKKITSQLKLPEDSDGSLILSNFGLGYAKNNESFEIVEIGEEVYIYLILSVDLKKEIHPSLYMNSYFFKIRLYEEEFEV